MSKIKYLLLFIIFTFSLFADTSKEKVSLQLIWKHQFEFAGFYMAKEKGYYDDVSLDVEIKEYQQGLDVVKEVEKEKSTFGLGYPSIILDKANGAKINLLNAIFQSSPHALMTLRSSNIKSIKDFKGKRIMINDNAARTASFRSMLQSQNVSFDSMVKQKYNFRIEDIIENKTDIIPVFLSNEVFYLDQQNIKYDIWDPKDYGFDFYDDLLFTSTNTLSKNSKMVENFRQASLKGWEYAFEHMDETIDLILKKYNTQNKSKEALKYEASKLKPLAYYKTSKLGNIDQNKTQRIIDIYSLMGLTHKNIDLEEFIFKENDRKIILTKEEMKFIRSHPVIRVHNETIYPPFNYNEKGEPKGYSVDLIELLAKKLNLDIKYISGPRWNDFIQMAKEQKLDVMLNIISSEEREKFLNFTTPYKQLSQSIFTNLDNINKLSDLDGKTVAIPEGFYLNSFLKENYPQIKILVYDDILQCIHSVIENKADALIENFAVVNFLLQKHNLSIKHVKLSIDKRLNFNLNLGVIKSKPILRDILQKAINSISEKELTQLNNKWLGIDAKKKGLKKISFTKEEKEYLAEKKKVTMCIDPEWMPFESLDKGKYTGISSDYFKLFEENLGFKIEVVKTKSWTESLTKAKNRECDLLSLAMETPNRKKFMNFTSPYLEVPLVIATNTDVTFINDIKTLTDKPIGIPKGYAYVELFKTKYPFLNIIEVENQLDGLEKVKEGKLFGYIGTLASVGYMFQTRFTGELKIAGKFDEKWRLGIGVRNDHPILLNIMQKAVDSIDKNEHQGILNNWIAIKYEKKMDYTALWQVLGFILIITLLIVYRQYVLNQANKNLKKAVEEKTKELKELNKNLEQKIKEAVEENSEKDRILFSQSKMAAMGEMIGNIAHQWRQPLSIISTAASGIQLKIELDMFNKKDTLKNLDSLVTASKYLSQTIDDFQNYLKPVSKKEEFNLKNTVNKVLEMFGNSFSNNDIEFDINMQDSFIVGSENELLQVIINILNNSKDALKESKTQRRLIFIDLKSLNSNIILTIKDNAGGIEEDILPKIFDAYFTTKHQSQGTGIGLYMSFQIINNSFNGIIKARNREFIYESERYKGAEFTITLPRNIKL